MKNGCAVIGCIVQINGTSYLYSNVLGPPFILLVLSKLDRFRRDTKAKCFQFTFHNFKDTKAKSSGLITPHSGASRTHTLCVCVALL